MVEILALAVIGYLIGSIPFGLILTKAAGYGDIRAIGSGNIGATNVLRTGNKKLALATLLLDGGKGAASVGLTYWLLQKCTDIQCTGAFHPCITPDMISPALMITGVAAIIGHMFPILLRFKGGKGVATTLGVLLALAPWVGAACCLIWLIMALAFRYSSLAALAAILASPTLAWLFTLDSNLAFTCSIIVLLVWVKHRANIKRLIAGEEPKIGKSKA